MSDIIKKLPSKGIASPESTSILEQLGKANSELLKRHVSKAGGSSLPERYSAELRASALTLRFYSPRAYNYVRKVFNTCLPHPRTLVKWYSPVYGLPGFSNETMNALRVKAAEREKSGRPIMCSLVLDEMAVRQHVEWDGKRYHGYVDIGSGADDDSLPVAKDALTFMIVAINDNWKLPVEYFLIEGVNGAQKTRLVHQYLTLVHDTCVKVVSITFDGAAANLTMAKNLGCQFDTGRPLKTSFPHPITGEYISVFLDPWHMIKLVRNTFWENKVLVDHEEYQVKWDLIEKFNYLQVKEGLHLANKLHSTHINWKNQPINVRLAALVFSPSVADASVECQKLSPPRFCYTTATIRFIRLINNLFDVLNSRNMRQKSWKKPLCPGNYVKVKDLLLTAMAFISKQKTFSGQLVITTS